jgi:heme/copper-type cytochrome/quinol oxidase subunit 1
MGVLGDHPKMTTIETHVGSPTHDKSTGSSFVIATGLWITSSDHKKIGRLFIGWSLLIALGTAIVGAILGAERMSPSSMQIFDGDAALQLFSLYHYALVLGILAPLFVGIAIAVVPMQIGSRAIAFPRLAQLGFWAWLFGAALVVISLIGNGGPGGGSKDLVDLYLLAVALTAAGLLAASLSVATTVLTSRAPGMELDMVPAFSWSALIGSVATLLSLPVTIGTAIYLYVDHENASLVFGGNKGISQFIGWSTSQPMTFVFVIMAFGVLAELAPVTARIRQPLRPIVLGALGLISSAVLGAVTQSAHVLDWSGTNSDKIKSAIPFLIFNGLPVLGAFVVVAVSLLSLKMGKPVVSASFAFAALGTLMILVGMAGNMINHISSAALVGTSFSEGVVVYLAYGGILTALGALTHWAPKLWGVVLDNTKVLGLVGLGLLATIAASFPMYIAGFVNQPADSVFGFEYDGPVALWNLLAAAGHALMALTVVAFVLLLVAALRSGEQASDDPFDAHTLEWAIPSPAPTDNFASLAQVNSSEPLLDVKPSSQEVSA